jgi:hypothetical protein
LGIVLQHIQAERRFGKKFFDVGREVFWRCSERFGCDIFFWRDLVELSDLFSWQQAIVFGSLGKLF